MRGDRRYINTVEEPWIGPEQIWYGGGPGFGDLWSSLHWCLRRSEDIGELVKLSRWNWYNRDFDCLDRLNEMLPLIDAPPSAKIKIVEDKPHNYIGGDCWNRMYYSTKVRWLNHHRKTVAYQFDGRSSGDQKNPPQEHIDMFLSWAKESGITAVRVGLPASIRECIDIMCSADAFVGACSGMSHLAISVGIPTYVVEYQQCVAEWYGPNKITVCQELDGFIKDYSGL